LFDGQARKVIEFYKDEAPIYDTLYHDPIARISDEITWSFTEPYLPNVGMVLDAGGGAGGWAVEMAKKGVKVMLYDLSPDMLREASKKIDRHSLSDYIEVGQGDICAMPFRDEEFDFVLCEADPLSYCVDPGKAIREISRVMRPNCFFVAGVESTYFRAFRALRNGQPLKEVLRILNTGTVPVQDENPPFNVHTFTTTKLERLLNENRLEVIKFAGKSVFASAVPYDVQDDIFESEEKVSLLFEIERKICDDSSIVGLGGHLHVVARKRG